MARSISIVEYKVQQTHFFLEKIREAQLDFFAAQCFVDAFAGAARSITFAMQSVISEVPGFAEWYQQQQSAISTDPICRFFNRYRAVATHIGDTVVRGGSTATDDAGRRVTKYYFLPVPDLPDVPNQDVLSICTHHFKGLLALVFNAMLTFKYQLDDQWYLTAENFSRLNKSVDDAEEELGFPRGWTAIPGVLSEPERWRALRRTQTVGCQLNGLFDTYLGKVIEGPDHDPNPLPPYASHPVGSPSGQA